ncbi:MAG: antibiotic biosynthesis monooxygenase [Sphingomonas sp.]|nr:antibiotic biosynthesis monooxygenase [Sphingomonas sp.]
MIVMVFEFTVEPAEYEAYLEESSALRTQLARIDGFISVERFASHSEPGRFVAIGYFRDEEAVRRWRNLPEHRRAQMLGRDRFFSEYRLVMAEALRDYSRRRRDTAPEDSNRAHIPGDA